jgi:enterochelin esterase-like enzyme
MSGVKARRFVRGGLLIVAAAALLTAGALIVLATHSRASRAGTFPARASLARTVSIACRSPALGGQFPTLVYLPASYGSSGRRYPVVYFLHGLPASPQSYTQNAFVAHALVSGHEQAIVVTPQGARENDSDREYLDWSSTENWPKAISRDLTTCIDHRFRTIASRKGRALIGLSAGGYGAFNVGLRSLQTFGAVESWSGYFVGTDPSGYHVLKLGSPAAQRAATVPDGPPLASEMARWPSLIAFYVGSSDDRFADANQVFDASLRDYGIPHVFHVYPGGHSAALWQAQAPTWLALALSYLATGETVLHRT